MEEKQEVNTFAAYQRLGTFLAGGFYYFLKYKNEIDLLQDGEYDKVEYNLRSRYRKNLERFVEIYGHVAKIHKGLYDFSKTKIFSAKN